MALTDQEWADLKTAGFPVGDDTKPDVQRLHAVVGKHYKSEDVRNGGWVVTERDPVDTDKRIDLHLQRRFDPQPGDPPLLRSAETGYAATFLRGK